jgi:putative flippase GtrA
LKQFLRFSIVGAIGYLIDVGVLYLFVLLINANPYSGRIVSFITAASATWLLNRRFTFQVVYKASRKEWLSYVSLMMLGALVNYGTYVLCLTYWLEVKERLWIGVATGSIAALSVNFTMSRLLFRKSHQSTVD